MWSRGDRDGQCLGCCWDPIQSVAKVFELDIGSLVMERQKRDRPMKKKVALVVLLLLIASGYFVASPFIAAEQLKSAIAKQDQQRLSECVDFPTVRQNLREQLNIALAKQAEKEQFGPFVVGLFLDKIVDAYVSPAGIADLACGRGIHGGANTERKNDEVSDRDLFPNAQYSFESSRKFSIRTLYENGGEVRFVLTRNDLTWRLTNIVLPTPEE